MECNAARTSLRSGCTHTPRRLFNRMVRAERVRFVTRVAAGAGKRNGPYLNQYEWRISHEHPQSHGAGRGIGTLGETNQAQPAYAGQPRTRCYAAHLPTILAREYRRIPSYGSRSLKNEILVASIRSIAVESVGCTTLRILKCSIGAGAHRSTAANRTVHAHAEVGSMSHKLLK